MGQYILRRALQAIMLAIGASTLTFILLHAVPGDPVRTILGEFATDEQVEALRHQIGLDRPIPEQYVVWLGNAARGDLGNSIAMNLPVSELIADRLPRTAELVALAIVFALAIGIPIGVISALNRGGRIDSGLTGVALLFLSVPSYVIGTLLVIVMGIQLRWLPASGYVPFGDDPIGHLKLLILPVTTLTLPLSASIARFTRSSVLEVVSQDYVRTARSKGLLERQVIQGHVLRTSLLPVTTVVGLRAGQLLGSIIIVETIFTWPGLSSLLFQGINTKDYPVVQGCVIVTALLFLLINLFVDVVNGLIDPRVAVGGGT
jgi:peptide/nickel transport system permease protein